MEISSTSSSYFPLSGFLNFSNFKMHFNSQNSPSLLIVVSSSGHCPIQHSGWENSGSWSPHIWKVLKLRNIQILPSCNSVCCALFFQLYINHMVLICRLVKYVFGNACQQGEFCSLYQGNSISRVGIEGFAINGSILEVGHLSVLLTFNKIGVGD